MATATRPVLKKCSLSRALRYQNRQIVLRFVDQYGVSLADAQDLFTETKKWIWLNAQPDAPRLAITYEMQMLDEMWHNFVLFTREFVQYCKSCYGRYMHHAPTTDAEKKRMRAEFKRDPKGAQERHERERAVQYNYIFDKLGAETLIKWKVELPYRFDRAFFLAAARKSAPAPMGREMRALLKKALREAGSKVVDAGRAGPKKSAPDRAGRLPTRAPAPTHKSAEGDQRHAHA